MPSAAPPPETDASPDGARGPARMPRRMRIVLALLCLGLVILGVARFPVFQAWLGGALVAYAALLWLWPPLFLLVLPVVLPAWDAGIWSGWLLVDEADFFVLATLGVLLLRDPPRLADLLPTGLARKVLLSFAAVWSLATILGLASPMGAPPSDNAFLRPDNALRLAKSFAEALVLLPFLRQRERRHSDAISLLGYGFAIGVFVVAVIVRMERALFVPFLDFSATYRVVGPFSSMRIGGGHIGAYAVLALPMALCLPRLRPRELGMLLLLTTSFLALFIVAVSFARAAYAAAAIAIVVAGFGWLWASLRQRRPFLMGTVPLLLVLVAGTIAAMTGGMRERLLIAAQDFLTHRANWRAGMAIRDTGLLADVFGMGLGTYQRAMLMRSPIERPSDVAIRRDADGTYLSLRIETEFFFDQKIAVPPAGNLHVSLRARAADAKATLAILVCDKVLLYSDQCRAENIELAAGAWQNLAVTLPVSGLGRPSGLSGLHRPVDLSFSGSVGHRIDIGDIRLVDDAGQELLRNADFSHGLDHWVFTDDTHVAWRMFNQYLMLWFETGALGVGAFLLLAGLAVAGGMRATWHGAVTGAAVTGSLVGFLASCLFDNLLEAPRVATLFFLVCLCGLVQFEERRRRPRLPGLRTRAGRLAAAQAAADTAR